jgi:hypothetical protein
MPRYSLNKISSLESNPNIAGLHVSDLLVIATG